MRGGLSGNMQVGCRLSIGSHASNERSHMNDMKILVAGRPHPDFPSVFAVGNSSGELQGIIINIIFPAAVGTFVGYWIIRRWAGQTGWPPNVFPRLPAAMMIGTLSYPLWVFGFLCSKWIGSGQVSSIAA
jgi:hypothetical protein